ncbi:MAG: cysteine-rich small domain-containing protein [Clostridia bacterium]|nr:cysteine-rich small domain-containing protein [Clostridia bacterium]
MSQPNDSTYFCNRECEYFPCHESEGEYFNCLFCYCPLYALGRDCGGRYSYTAQGIKDCSACTLPHERGGYAWVQSRIAELIRQVAKKDKAQFVRQEKEGETL